MDVQARIVARKVCLIYLYQRIFVNDISIDEDELKKFSKSQDKSDIKFTGDAKVLEQLMGNDYESDVQSDVISDEEVIQNIQNLYTDERIWEDVEYIIDIGFASSKSKDKIDYDYIREILEVYTSYNDEISDKIDQYTDTFNYDEMDVMDRAIFLLGYIENNEFDTPKNVLINEMIELAKNYGDEGSSKLINAIADNLIL